MEEEWSIQRPSSLHRPLFLSILPPHNESDDIKGQCNLFQQMPEYSICISLPRVHWESNQWHQRPIIILFLNSKVPTIGFPSGSNGKESTCNAGHPGLISGSGRSPREGNGNPLQYSHLENPTERSLGGHSLCGRKESDTTETLTLSLFRVPTKCKIQ